MSPAEVVVHVPDPQLAVSVAPLASIAATVAPVDLPVVFAANAGPPGAPGEVGPEGPQGPIGISGPRGPVGPDGPAGPQGPVGPVGPTGNTGAAGPTGPTGAQGSVGPPGPQGSTGPAGPTGSTGATGSTGPQGSKGDPGPPGQLATMNPTLVYGPGAPNEGEAILDSSNPAAVTRARLPRTDFYGADNGALLGSMGPPLIIRIGSYSDASQYIELACASAPVVAATYVEYAVTHKSHGGTLASGTSVLVYVMGPIPNPTNVGPAGPQGAKGDTGATGPQGTAGATGAQGPQGAAGFSAEENRVLPIVYPNFPGSIAVLTAANRFNASRAIVPRTGFLRDVSYWAGSVGTGTVLVAVFDVGEAQAGASITKLWESGVVNNTSVNQWRTFDPNIPVTAGQHVHIGLMCSNITDTFARNAAGASPNGLAQFPPGFLPGAMLPKPIVVYNSAGMSLPTTITEANLTAAGTSSIPWLMARVS